MVTPVAQHATRPGTRRTIESSEGARRRALDSSVKLAAVG